jgi:hypothetical protein
MIHCHALKVQFDVFSTEFGGLDGQLGGVELELGIDRDWEGDMEGNDGQVVNVVGHKEALEMTL